MNTFAMRELFGAFLADGDVANRFRFCEVERVMSLSDSIIFDFDGVTNMTDSFCNALFETLAADHGDLVRSKFRFRNCSPVVKHFIANAMATGLAEASRRRH